MGCRQIFFNINKAVGGATGSYTMTDNEGNYVFYNVPCAQLNGVTYSINNTTTSFRLTNFSQSGSYSICNPVPLMTNGIYRYYDYGNTASYSGVTASGGRTLVFDLSGNNQTAAVIGSPTFNSAGNLSNFQFTGNTNQYIDTYSSNVMGSFTWHVVVQNPNNTARSCIMDATGAGSPIGCTLEIGTIPGSGTKGTRILFHDGNHAVEVKTDNTVSNNTMYLFTMTWDSTAKTGTLFQNGTQIAQGTNIIVGTVTNYSWDLRFGNGYDQNNGTYALSSVCKEYLHIVYSRLLSNAEIVSHYNTLKTRFGLS